MAGRKIERNANRVAQEGEEAERNRRRLVDIREGVGNTRVTDEVRAEGTYNAGILQGRVDSHKSQVIRRNSLPRSWGLQPRHQHVRGGAEFRL